MDIASDLGIIALMVVQLYATLNPASVISTYLSLMEEVDKIQRRHLLRKAVITVFLLVSVFLLGRLMAIIIAATAAEMIHTALYNWGIAKV